MSNILKYQNPSSSLLINTGYTTHSNKELNDIETFNSNWFKYRDSQLANSARRNPHRFGELNSLQKAFPLWVSDDKLANVSRDWINNRLGSVVETHTSEALKDEKHREILKEIYHEYFPYGAVDSKTLTPREITDSDLKYIDQLRGGTYIIPDHTIIYADGNQNTTAKIHERLHAAQPTLPHSVDRTPIGRQAGVHFDKYYDSQKEIYARLMELRYANKLDPSHTYTIKEVKAMRDDPNFKDSHIFDRYTDDYILMLLNEVAQNTTNPNRIDYKDPVTFAKKGGCIHIKKKNRGKFTEYCGGKVTEECIAKGKNSKNPLTRKRANFASVVRKWKHENGGILKAQEGTPKYGLPSGVSTYMQTQPLSPIDIAIKTAQSHILTK